MAHLKPLTTAGSLADRAAAALRDEILSGAFQLGERLNEAKIARELGISRGPVREALARLRAEGLVQEESRRGSFIPDLSADDVREIYDLRGALELRAVRLVLQHQAPWLGELEHALKRLREAATAGGAREVAKADLHFHEALCRLSGNGRLLAVFRGHVPILRILLSVEERRFFPDLFDVVKDHEALLLVLQSGDPADAQSTFDGHLEDAKVRLVQYVDERQAARSYVR